MIGNGRTPEIMSVREKAALVDRLTHGASFNALVTKFVSFVNATDERNGVGSDDHISFSDPGCVLFEQEGYKDRVWRDAQERLGFPWAESEVGSGGISERVAATFRVKTNNFVNYHSELKMTNYLADPKTAEKGERILYNIFYSSNEKSAFESAHAVFKAPYNLVSYLFFLKDDERFLPVKSTRIDSAFRAINVDYRVGGNASWDNYRGFLDRVDAVREALEATLPVAGGVTLLDAHSFLWVTQNYSDFKSYEESEQTRISRESLQAAWAERYGSGAREPWTPTRPARPRALADWKRDEIIAEVRRIARSRGCKVSDSFEKNAKFSTDDELQSKFLVPEDPVADRNSPEAIMRVEVADRDAKRYFVPAHQE